MNPIKTSGVNSDALEEYRHQIKSEAINQGTDNTMANNNGQN